MKTPREAKTFEQICELRSDGADVADNFWCSVDENTFAIYQQKVGEHPTQKIIISRKAFNQIVDWYNTGSRRPTKRAADGLKAGAKSKVSKGKGGSKAARA